MQKNKLNVKNIKCSGCVESIVKKLLEIPGITDVRVSIADSTVEYFYSGDVPPDLVYSSLENIGYPVQDPL